MSANYICVLRRAVKNCRYSHKGTSNVYSQHFYGKIRKIFAWKEFIAPQKIGNQKKYYIVHKKHGYSFEKPQ